MYRIVMITGGVETLEYFTYQMGKTFEKEGYPVFYYNLEDGAAGAKKLRKFVRPGKTVLITFNFEGLEKEAGIYDERRGYLWDEYQMPCYNIIVDHPYYYHDRIADLPEKYHHISIDRCHEKYFREFYPEYDHQGFLPLAGTAAQENVTEQESMTAREGISSPENLTAPDARGMDVIFTGNYTPPSFCEKYIHRINEEYAAFYQKILDELIACPDKTVEDVVRAHCAEEMGDVSREDMRLVMHNMTFIDIYVRNYWRGRAVQTLVDAGIVVDVFGKGWEQLACEHPECLRIHPQTTSLECLRQIKRAKVSLNVMPWFKDGAHDRVFNSVLNGTVCVTDRSKYLCEELQDGGGVRYYELEHIEALPEIVSRLLEDNKERQMLLERGLEKIEADHTWDVRARQLIAWFS